MKYSKYNVVIIGSGLAGLYLANKLSKNSNFQDGILLVTKEQVFSGSTSLAQGGIVSVIPEINPKDTIESHIKDTIKAGCGLNNINSVKFVSENSALIAQELMSFGVEFDRNEKNMLNFTLEGAHSQARILHCSGDSTGKVIEKTLTNNILKQENIDIYTNTMAIELLIDDNKTCHGIIVYNWELKELEVVYSNNVVIATGGIGQLYKNTTNPETSCSDGVALAYSAGAEVENMEFVQFHPTGLYCENKTVMPLVSESVRGEGAKLVDLDGNYFAKNYDKLADLAPRDVVARAIKEQMKLTDTNYVNLDISQIGIENFRKRFPTITSLCEENNIDITNGLIPVVPVQHYFMGGIKTDLNSKTTIENVYAIGECSSTGLHGANRLASNSLLECAVFAQNLSENLIKNSCIAPKKYSEKIKSIIDKYDNDFNINYVNDDKINELFNKLKITMTENVSIERNNKGLNIAKNEILSIENELNSISDNISKRLFELKFAVITSKLITEAAILRKNSIGAHYRTDYPHKALISNKGEYINDSILAR